MIKIIEKGLAENPSMMCKSCYQANDVALDAIRMCRNSEFKDPILHVENNPTRMCGNSECGGHYMSLNGGDLNALRMCRNSEFKDPLLHVENNPTRMCGNSECGGHYMSLNGGTLNALRMCRNSEFKDPVYVHELCAKAS